MLQGCWSPVFLKSRLEYVEDPKIPKISRSENRTEVANMRICMVMTPNENAGPLWLPSWTGLNTEIYVEKFL